jgi:hypothetical protein
MQGYQLQAYLKLLHLGSCDMVIKVDQLRRYSLILFDFIKMKIFFRKEKRPIELKEIVEEVILKMIITIKVHKNLNLICLILFSNCFQ